MLKSRDRELDQGWLGMVVANYSEIVPHRSVNGARPVLAEAMLERIADSVHAKMLGAPRVVAIQKWTLLGHTSHRLRFIGTTDSPT